MRYWLKQYLLIVGGAGYIGSQTNKLLSESGLKTIVFDNFAAYTAVGGSVADPAKYYRNNVVHTLNLLNAMRGAAVKTLVFSSSAAVYGIPAKIPIVEAVPLRPVNLYGRTNSLLKKPPR